MSQPMVSPEESGEITLATLEPKIPDSRENGFRTSKRSKNLRNPSVFVAGRPRGVSFWICWQKSGKTGFGTFLALFQKSALECSKKGQSLRNPSVFVAGRPRGVGFWICWQKSGKTGFGTFLALFVIGA